jgi:hypothetical protein
MPQFKTRDDLKIQLDRCGYSDVTDGKTSKTVVIQLPKGGDREGSLRESATKLKSFGAKYNPTGGQSSVGRTECSGGFNIECKIKGGGGSGAGSDITELAESAQCVYLAAKYNKKGDYSHASLDSAKRSYDVSDTLKRINDKITDDWVDSSKLGAVEIAKKFPNAGKSYVAHRGSTWVTALENHWKVLNNEAGKPFTNLNKWSPADMYIVSSKGKTIDLTKANTLIELNAMMLDAYKSKDIVGISLKKMRGTAQFKELNISNNRNVYEFVSSTTGLRGFFQSGDGYIMFNGGKAQFRKFGSTWQGELKGKNANMGKVSGGPVIGFVKEYFKKDMTPQRDLSVADDATIDQFYEWYNACSDTPAMDKYDFYKEVQAKDMNWFVSKIMTAQLMAIVDNAPKKQQDAFTSGMVNYAASESILSGPYCKVY